MPQLPIETYIQTGEVALNVARWPGEPDTTRTPVLFIHGITDNSESWYQVAPGIRKGALAIAPDLRGHGRSGRASGHYLFTDYPRDIISLIESETDGPVHLIGHSLGAVIGVQVAAQRPDLVHSLVLEDPPFYFQQVVAENPQRAEHFKRNAMLSGSGMSVQEMANTIREFVPDLPEEKALEHAHALFVTDASVIEHAVALITDSSASWITLVESVLQAIQCPTLLLQGNDVLEDRRPVSVMRPQDGDRVLELIPNCEREFWPDWGHLLHNNDPERFVRQVRGFIDSLPSVS